MQRDLFENLIKKYVAVRILLVLRKSHKPRWGFQLTKELDTTYSHSNRILEFLNEVGLVKGKREGRKIIITLTPKGGKVADKLNELKELLR